MTVNFSGDKFKSNETFHKNMEMLRIIYERAQRILGEQIEEKEREQKSCRKKNTSCHLVDKSRFEELYTKKMKKQRADDILTVNKILNLRRKLVYLKLNSMIE